MTAKKTRSLYWGIYSNKQDERVNTVYAESSALADDESMEYSSGVPRLSVCFVVNMSSWFGRASRRVDSILVCESVAPTDARCELYLETDA